MYVDRHMCICIYVVCTQGLYSVNYPWKNHHVFSRKSICIFFIPSTSSLQVKSYFGVLFYDLDLHQQLGY